MADCAQRVTRQPYWRDALRSLKRAVLARDTVFLGNRKFRVAYEARGHKDEPDYPLLREFSRGQDCVFDVGANVGMTALVMLSSMAPLGKIYALEASEASCLVIRENALLNELSERIQIVNAVVWDKSGAVIEFDWDLVSSNSSAAYKSPFGMFLPMQKATLALDDFIKATGCRPGFVKIDVEGAEGRVLAGMRETLQSARPSVFVELHSWPGFDLRKNAESILKLLKDVKYRMIRVSSQRVIVDADASAESINASTTYARAWAVLFPNEVAVPEWFAAFDTSTLS